MPPLSENEEVLSGNEQQRSRAIKIFLPTATELCAEGFFDELLGNGRLHFSDGSAPVCELLLQTRQRDAIAFETSEAILFRLTIQGFLRFRFTADESASPRDERGWRGVN